MPPLWMFEGRSRPSGLEFPACKACNQGTKTADLVAGFVARMMECMDMHSLAFRENKERLRRLKRDAPDVLEEIFRGEKLEAVLINWRGAYRLSSSTSEQGYGRADRGHRE